MLTSACFVCLLWWAWRRVHEPWTWPKPNYGILIPHASVRKRTNARFSDRVTRTPILLLRLWSRRWLLVFFLFLSPQIHVTAAMLCAVLQLRPRVATTTSWTWVATYSLTGSIFLSFYLKLSILKFLLVTFYCNLFVQIFMHNLRIYIFIIQIINTTFLSRILCT